VVGKEHEEVAVTALRFTKRTALMLRDRRAEKLGKFAGGRAPDRADCRFCATMPCGSALFPVHRGDLWLSESWSSC